MYRWIVLLHILGAVAFFMAHGVSAAMALRLRRETNLERLCTLLGLSEVAVPVMYFSLLVLLLAGIGAGIMGNWFVQGWIWAALVLLIVLGLWMGYYAQKHYSPIRQALGITYRGRPGANPPASESEVAALVQATNPGMLTGVSFVVIAIILWLMIFKPF
ncbi:MAG: hypothetical protein ABI690_31130 [Chloroflexota bacterium]